MIGFDARPPGNGEADARLAAEFSMLAVMQHAGDAIWIAGADGRYQYANPSACKALGYGLEEMLGLYIPDLLPEEIRDQLPAHLELLERVSHDRREWPMRRKDGSRAIFELTTQRLPDGRYLAMGYDLDGKRLAELKLRESERLYHSLFEHMLNGFAYCRMLYRDGRPVDFVYLEVNAAFTHLTGLEDVVGRKVSEAIPGILETSPDLIATYGRVADSGRPETFETYVEALRKWFSISVYSPCKEHFVAVFDVVTERKLSEQWLMASEQRLRYAMMATGEGLWDWDIVTGTVQHNAQWCQLLALDETYLEHSVDFFVALIHEDDRPEVHGLLRRALAEDVQYLSKHRMRRGDGEYIWVLDRGRVVERDAEGNPLRMVGSFADISEGKRMGAELDRHRHHLEELVGQRTLELAAARDAAEAASRAKSAFLANMSHAIRTPMNAIIGLTHLLRRDSQDARQKDQLGKVSDAANHLLEIINEILDLSKIEAGRIVIEAIEFDLDGLLDSVGNLVAEQARAKGLELRLDSDPALSRAVHGDPLRLRQMLLNYVSNAIKFTERGAIMIRSRLLEEGDGHLLARFEVEDHGIGIAEADRDRLFREFEQADSSTTRKYGGTGLGLAINQRLAQLMGGEVGLESRLGVGSTFWFSVRLVKCRHRQARCHPAMDLRGLRALVVDDVAESRDLLADLLWSLGMEMATAATGEEALESVAAADAIGMPFDVVLIDWRMPGMDGIETVRRLGALALSRAPVSVLVTAQDHLLCHEEAALAGIAAVLAKPVDIARLGATLRRVLHRQPVETAASSGAEQALIGGYTGRRILLVDDDPISREVTRDLIEKVGLSVELADDGAEALSRIRQRPYDLVLMDVQMPVMDGYQASAAIRRMPNLAGLAIVAMTAGAFEDDRAASLAAGMNAHLSKPVEPEILYATLLKWLPGSGPVAAAPRPGLPEQPAETDRDLIAALSEVPGLDVEFGLKSLMGSPTKYIRMLHRYTESHADDVALMGNLLAGDQGRDALRLIHSLKGLSGTLGARRIQDLAARLEASLKQGLPDRAVARELENAMGQLAAAVAALPACREATAPAVVDIAQENDILDELEALLAEDNMLANACLRKSQATLRVVLGARYAELAGLIDDYRYEQALSLLRSLRLKP